jgi:hypothetical protein
MSLRVSRIWGSVVITIAGLWGAGAASASQPEGFEVNVSRTSTSSNLCGFSLEVHVEGPLRFTDHYDQSGRFVQEIERFHLFSITWTNPETGVSLSGESSGQHTFSDIVFSPDESVSYTAETSGALRRVHVPGEGEITGVIGHPVDSVVEYADGTVTVDAVFETRKAADDNIAPFCHYLA